MILAGLLIVLGGLCCALIVALVVSGPRDRLLRERLRHDVVVTLKSGEAFRGVLYAADAHTFVLRDAKALTDASARPVPVDGELMLFRRDIDYWQRP